MKLLKLKFLRFEAVFGFGFELFSFGVFLYYGQINWELGFTLAIGNGIGGWLGSKFAITKGDKWIQIVLFITVTIMAIKLLLS